MVAIGSEAVSQNTFEVVFSGKLVEGAVLEQVKAKVAAMFKVEVAKVERLFSGATVSIKKGIDEATAKKYQMALQKAGAICQVVNRAAAAAAPTPPASPAAPPPVAPAAVTPEAAPVAETGTASELGLHKSVVKEVPQGLGELGGVSIDAPGVTLVEHEEIPVPQIDTAALSLDQVGAELTEHEEVPEPQVDTSAFSMGEAGEILSEEEPEEELEIDISALDMDEPGVTLVEHKEVPKPDIDTSKLSLD
jgi:hypothetical protein